jgi:hypothetical protein
LEISNYKTGKGFQKGTFNLKFPAIVNNKNYVFTYRDCAWFEKDNSRWMSMPSKPYEKEGQKKFFQQIVLDTPEMKADFEKDAFDALDKHLRESPAPSQEELPF